MKTLIFFFCSAVFSITPNHVLSQNVKVKIDHDKTVSIDEVFKLISNQTDYKFIYQADLFKDLPKVHITKGTIKLNRLLNKCFSVSNYNFEISENNSIVINAKPDIIIKKTKQKQVTGTIIDNYGVPLPGVNVIAKGTSTGTSTDFDGNFSLNVEEGAVLVISYLGFKTVEIPIGTQTVINITLEEDAASLDEVVINALGFAVKTDKLGSAVSSVKAEAITRSGETSITNAIQGKMSGVNITRSNGDPGSGSNIRIRGANTISGNTQPLIIVDGIPISNSNNNGGGSNSTANGTSQQSRLNDINPNDIETLQVLKGASAAALWGSRASNGVVIITTKSGKKGFRVSLKTTVAFDEVTETQLLQSNYGPGSSGVYRQDFLRAWGDEISDRAGGEDVVDTNGAYFIGDQTGTIYYPIARGSSSNPHGGKRSRETFLDKNFDQIFQTGLLTEQSLSISGGNDKGNIFFSLGNTDHDGVIRNNDYKRHTVNISATRKFNDFISLKLKGKYSRVGANRIQQNSNLAGLLLGFYRTPPDFDISDYSGTYVSASGAEIAGRHRSYRNPIGASNRPFYNNPLWTTNKQKAPNTVNRHIYSAELDVFPTKGLNIKLRGGVDTYNDARTYLFPKGSARTTTPPLFRIDGSLLQENLSGTELNFDAIAKYDTDITEDISSSYVLGWNINDRKFNRTTAIGNDFIVDQEIYNLTNSRVTTSENFITHRRSNRGFATANFGVFDQLFIDVSGTVEAASTIGKPFFYPAASAAWQFSDANFFPEESFISFAKVRLSWGKVGIQPDLYRSSTNYEGDFSYSSGLAGTLSSTSNGGGFRLDNRRGNTNLRPEIKTEIETGLELRFFDNALSTSFTYYNNDIEDILLTLDQSASSGFTSFYTNGAAIENNGFEFEFNAKLLRDNDNWSFSPYGNFATNKNEVTDLSGADIQPLTGFGTGDSVAAVGHQMGALFGGKLPRNADGSIELDANGFPVGSPEYDIIGDPNPDWTGGLGFNLAYKNVSMNVLFEHSQGGDFYDITRQINTQRGHSLESGNKATIPAGGVVDVNGNAYAAGDVVRGNLYDFGAGNVLLEESWYRGNGAGNRGFSELWLQDATWTRLRELTLTYSLGQNILDKLKLSAVNFSVTGRNLVLWTDVIGNDPDKNFAGVGNSRGLDYYTNPSTKSYMFNLNITF
ncbi:SusC/RagA family TonB-linked outer membrane protein [Flavobacteriaceae bacterium LMO-SS05]